MMSTWRIEFVQNLSQFDPILSQNWFQSLLSGHLLTLRGWIWSQFEQQLHTSGTGPPPRKPFSPLVRLFHAFYPLLWQLWLLCLLWLLWLLDTLATLATMAAMATLATLDYGYTGYTGYFSPIRSGLLCPANVLLLLLGRPLNCQNWKGLGNFKMRAKPNYIMRVQIVQIMRFYTLRQFCKLDIICKRVVY